MFIQTPDVLSARCVRQRVLNEAVIIFNGLPPDASGHQLPAQTERFECEESGV